MQDQSVCSTEDAVLIDCLIASAVIVVSSSSPMIIANISCLRLVTSLSYATVRVKVCGHAPKNKRAQPDCEAAMMLSRHHVLFLPIRQTSFQTYTVECEACSPNAMLFNSKARRPALLNRGIVQFVKFNKGKVCAIVLYFLARPLAHFCLGLSRGLVSHAR